MGAYFLATASDKHMHLLTSRFTRGRLVKMTCYFDNCICHQNWNWDMVLRDDAMLVLVTAICGQCGQCNAALVEYSND